MKPLKNEPRFKIEKEDIQGIISRGYNSLNAARYILLEIVDVIPAKQYVKNVANHITAANVSTQVDVNRNGDPNTAVQIAFTYTGLKKLGLPDKVCNTFSREFIEGMSFIHPDTKVEERSTLLGDTENNHPSKWIWGNQEKKVDCVLMLFAFHEADLIRLIKTIYDDSNPAIKLVYMGGTYDYDPDISKEHFGFDDGIAQPIIKGLSETKENSGETLVNPGEFILGYSNEYDSYSPSPYVDDDAKSRELPFSPSVHGKKDLGKNGSYMVFRQMEQHVESFWYHLYHQSKENATTKTAKAIKLGAKMVGRWPDGSPLVTCPEGVSPIAKEDKNKFYYANQDKHGVNCPLGAHIRRTNPRDQVHTGRSVESSLEVTSRHRMLRRGRIYGQPLDKSFDAEKMILLVKDLSEEKISEIRKSFKRGTRGLHFICMVSDIQRQFEFVQNVWANTSTFGNLCNEVDPLISPRPTNGQPHCHEFTTPQDIIRNRYENVPVFTTVVGGAYFFMPGIKALKYILQ